MNEPGHEASLIETDVLIVGTGPAGAAAAALLARLGVATLTISRHRGTADTPRAHIVNQRTMEVMRDAGLEQTCIAAGSSGTLLAHTFWLRSMAGEELARAWAWGNDPARLSDYLTSSPCRVLDLPQSRMEPILVAEATRLGGQVRFGWELLDFDQDASGVTSRLADRLTGATITVRAKYMIGADGARSRVVEMLGLPLVGRHGLGEVINVLCEVDLAAHVTHRHGSLYNVVQPGSSTWGPVAVWRMVRPWDQWLVGLVMPHGTEATEPDEAELVQRIRETAGDEHLPVRILSVSRWQVNDVYAERCAQGRVFCIGDAIHRHPPANALGSNTCVQDAFNLAWKLAYVLLGHAGPGLLDSFDAERQPVARQIVERANKSFAHSLRMMDLMGAGTRTRMSAEEQAAVFTSAAGRAGLRAELAEARYNGLAHGVEMTRTYRSVAVAGDDPIAVELEGERDPELYHQPTTRPGSVVPHAWVGSRAPGPLRSILDLCGHGGFALLIGPGGERWRTAAKTCAGDVPLDTIAIGSLLDFEDSYGDWFRLRGVEDDGCVLVRPDLIVAWRCSTMPEDPVTALAAALGQVLDRREEATAQDHR